MISGKSKNPDIQTRRRISGIALRITLLTWLLSLVILAIFVMITIPQQKNTFLKNLQSKANSVAVSLHDVAAGAAVNEDYASVVSAAQTLLAGDPDLNFLVIAKNDGFGLFIEQSGWKSAEKVQEPWLPRERKISSGIQFLSFFNQEVFHYAQPFDYSGIQWGWIHVGLSLKGYYQSVASLYRNTGMLAMGCIVFSLLISLLYARQLVRPILRLRQVVQRIADGDLSVRANMIRKDELGSLALSVNTMAEALLRRDRILESVRFAAQQFMQTSRWEDMILSALMKIGQAADASRAYIYVNHAADDGRLYFSRQHEWTAPDASPQLGNPDLQNLSYAAPGFERWSAVLGRNQIVAGLVDTINADERVIFESQGIRSFILVSIFVEGVWWGFLGLDDCVHDRQWTDAEKDSMSTFADMLGATIARQRFQEALLEATSLLELRVKERTHELQEQIIAKEKALIDLGKAQGALMEMSRAEGMAEVATGVLHNVGNVLNSVNVSCNLLTDQLQQSRVGNLSRLASLLAEPEGSLTRFLTEDPRGRKIPVYLTSLAAALEEEQSFMVKEAESLRNRIDHIKEIINMQQSYSRVSGVQEIIPPEQLMEDALKFNAEALTRHSIMIQRQYQPVPAVTVDKHKVLQILLNLIQNAKYACAQSDSREKIITLCISQSHDRVAMQVADNGIGILPENLTRIFQHGFTTRKSGHGFGLHIGALAARELGGRLSVHSDGTGAGAVFTLELPCHSGDRI